MKLKRERDERIRELEAELAGYKRALKCANDQLGELDPTNARAVFPVPFEPDADGEAKP